MFKEADDEGKVVMWFILYDQGYRAKMAAWLEGKQKVLRLPASKSNERFSDRITVYAVTIDHDWSGNKRVVNVCKQSAMMKRGFKLNMINIRFKYKMFDSLLSKYHIKFYFPQV